MCSIGGPANLEMDELKWYKYRCRKCGHIYKSTGKHSVCPDCKSDEVEKI